MFSSKVFLILVVCCLAIVNAHAAVLSIYDIQYTEDVSGSSDYDLQTVDCGGGIVINKWVGGSTKLTIYDPANPDGWGGIIAKSFGGEFDSIQAGDWVSFDDVLVEERSGNTQLSYDTGTVVNVLSTGNSIPAALDITDPAFSERYESMMVKVSDVEITQMDLGKYGDNYNLSNVSGDYWAGDYMNIEAGGRYHSYVSSGAAFASVSGIIEHKISDDWDYYQMLTTGTGDFVVPEPGTIGLLLGGTLLLRKRKKQ